MEPVTVWKFFPLNLDFLQAGINVCYQILCHYYIFLWHVIRETTLRSGWVEPVVLCWKRRVWKFCHVAAESILWLTETALWGRAKPGSWCLNPSGCPKPFVCCPVEPRIQIFHIWVVQLLLKMEVNSCSQGLFFNSEYMQRTLGYLKNAATAFKCF